MRPDQSPVGIVGPPVQFSRQLHGHQVNAVNQGITILSSDELSAGGAPKYHSFLIRRRGAIEPQVVVIPWHEGDPAEVGTTGLTFEATLEALIDRLQHLQHGPFPCKHNEMAMRHLIEARRCMNDRTAERIERGVDGKPVP
jgi:hypothetical protein